MPPQLTYPGVYIEELSSGVHTITGVATSIAAFAGWANQGPTNKATLVLSFTDFQSKFGWDSRSYLGYAVNQFFANGGQQAYIIRIVWDGTQAPVANTSPKPCNTAFQHNVGGVLNLYASSPGAWGGKGAWGNGLQVSITLAPAAGGGTSPVRFQLQVLLNSSLKESFPNLSTDPTDPQYVVAVINSRSNYITFINPNPPDPNNPAPPPISTTGTLTSTPSTLPFFTATADYDGSVLYPKDGVNALADGNFEIALESAKLPTNATTFTAGYRLLDRVFFNQLCVPGEADAQTIRDLQSYCAGKVVTGIRAFLIVDCPQSATFDTLSAGPVALPSSSSDDGTLGATAAGADYSAYYFPWLSAPDPLNGNRDRLFPPCGFMAGIYAATDSDRGVWKAPAGIEANPSGVSGLPYILNDRENGVLNIQAINCLRQFKTYGNVVWGARTLAGNDQVGSQWKYIPIRRTALFIESSLYEGTQWVVFEPNDEPLWSQIRLNVGAFMQGLFLQGAFQGSTPQQAYFVKCDSENNPQASIDLGIVNILVGFAPLYPAEFVVIQIQQMAGQLQS